MQEIFEHTIQQQFGNFSIEPSNQTWLEIEKALHPHHEKRGAFWWWVPLAGIIVAGIMWNFYNKNIPSIEQGMKNLPSLPEHKNITEIKRDSVTKTVINTQNDSPEKCKEKNGYCEVIHRAVAVSNHTKKLKIADEITTAESDFNKDEKILNKEDEKQNTVQKDIVAKKENDDVTENRVSSSNITAKNEVSKDEITRKIDSSVSVTKQATNTSAAKNKSKWFVVGEGGLLNINSNLFSFSKISPAYASAPSNSVGSGGSSQSYPSITGADKGFGFAVGVHRQSQISEHWSFETGLMYRYFQNKQTVGSRQDSSLGNNKTYSIANYYYKAGNTNSITNYAHSIEIPLLLNYTINPKQKNKFYLQAGIEAGYMFAKKWIITDEIWNSYYYQSSLLKSFQLNTLLGVGINFNNHIQTNIYFRQAVTPLYKTNNNKTYTNQLALQVLIPVSLKNKK